MGECERARNSPATAANCTEVLRGGAMMAAKPRRARRHCGNRRWIVADSSRRDFESHTTFRSESRARSEVGQALRSRILDRIGSGMLFQCWVPLLWGRMGTSDHRGFGGHNNKNAGPLKHGPAQIGLPQFHSMSEVRHTWNWNETAVLKACKLLKTWWPGTDLNRRRQPFQGCALPIYQRALF
jgi:hypothetical protein